MTGAILARADGPPTAWPARTEGRDAARGAGRPAARGPRVVHTIGSLADEAAGPTYSVPAMGLAQVRQGASVRIMSLDADPPPRGDGLRCEGFRADFAGLPVLGRLQASAALRRALGAGGIDVVHTHQLWTFLNLYGGWLGPGGPRHVIAPRGMLHPAALSFSRGRKRLFDALLQRRVLERAHLLHATSVAELEDIRAYGLANPVAVVPNGIDVPAARPRAEAGDPTRRTVLSLGRIHPKKGLDRLVAAWGRVEADHPDWDLLIVGPDSCGHAGELAALARRLGLSRVRVSGPLFGEARTRLYGAASLFVLPTLGENFAMTVAESLAAGTPVVSTKGAPWQGLREHRCGWWIDHGVEPLAATMRAAMALPAAELCAMGERGRAWMAASFSWDAFAADMMRVYRWLLKGGERPAVVDVPSGATRR